LRKIAHRGNIDGPSKYENQPRHIQKALDLGYDAEIDIWSIRGKLWLGHDKADYLVDLDFLLRNKERLWIHCKNLEALSYFVSLDPTFQYFWHEKDDHTLTSNNFIWTYPGKKTTEKSIIVTFEKTLSQENLQVFGVCSDYVSNL
jgi:hypothetical protein